MCHKGGLWFQEDKMDLIKLMMQWKSLVPNYIYLHIIIIFAYIYIHIIGFNKTDDMTQLKSLVPNGNIYILMC